MYKVKNGPFITKTEVKKLLKEELEKQGYKVKAIGYGCSNYYTAIQEGNMVYGLIINNYQIELNAIGELVVNLGTLISEFDVDNFYISIFSSCPQRIFNHLTNLQELYINNARTELEIKKATEWRKTVKENMAKKEENKVIPFKSGEVIKVTIPMEFANGEKYSYFAKPRKQRVIALREEHDFKLIPKGHKYIELKNEDEETSYLVFHVNVTFPRKRLSWYTRIESVVGNWKDNSRVKE